MSLYERRYEVHANYVSHYTDDPEQALRFYEAGLGHEPPPWINEGYADHKDMDGGTMVTRRQIGPVLPSTLELMVQRKVVRRMLDEARATTTTEGTT